MSAKSGVAGIRHSRPHFHHHFGAKAKHTTSPLSSCCPATISLTRRSFIAGAKLAFGAAFAAGAGLAAANVSAASGQDVGAIGDGHHGGGGVACFLAGTRIRTTSGLVAVEELHIGDTVFTVLGDVKPIKWIGKQEATSTAPVKIAKFAIDGTAPLRDLYVTPRHAIYIDGYLVPAINLVNGTTVIANSKAELSTYTYYHIEFENHEVIEAEGLTVESYLAEDGVDFSNADDYVALYGHRAYWMVPFAPMLTYDGLAHEFASYARSAFACIYDMRAPLDKIRDRIADQAELAKAA